MSHQTRASYIRLISPFLSLKEESKKQPSSLGADLRCPATDCHSQQAQRGHQSWMTSCFLCSGDFSRIEAGMSAGCVIRASLECELLCLRNGCPQLQHCSCCFCSFMVSLFVGTQDNPCVQRNPGVSDGGRGGGDDGGLGDVHEEPGTGSVWIPLCLNWPFLEPERWIYN